MNLARVNQDDWTGTRSQRAFSLVEVTLALGIIAFSLVAILGLVPAGLRSVSDATNEAAGSNATAQICSAIRNASSTDNKNFSAPLGTSQLTYEVGGTEVTYNLTSLGLSGVPTTSSINGRMAAHVVITPPPDLHTPGRVVVSVAWPVVATYSSGKWNKAQGTVDTAIQFLPK